MEGVQCSGQQLKRRLEEGPEIRDSSGDPSRRYSVPAAERLLAARSRRFVTPHVLPTQRMCDIIRSSTLALTVE